MRIHSALFALFFFSLLVVNAQSPQVQTEYGTVTGNQIDEVYEFLGIPFASPPTGELRWRPPVPPQPWSMPLLTQEFGPKCMQKSFDQGDTTAVFVGDEDCLYLNVWTPDTTAAGLPVMVFIHGGGNQQGSASAFTLGTHLYNGKNLSDRGNVVVVTIQYRLGPLGFLVHPGLEMENEENTSGNYAVMDQILALEWVQNNIAAFGGDASRVMIFGESAGGVNVGNLMLTPMASGLFHRACIQSASPNLQGYSDAIENGIAYTDGFIDSGTDVEKIAYMRSLDAGTLVANLESPLNGGFVQSKWKPVIDNYLFDNSPLNTIQSGSFNKVPFMIGSNADEMSISAPATVTQAMVNALINLYIPFNYRPLAEDLYADEGTPRDTYVQLLTDAQFTAPARRTARCVSQNQEAPVYRYFFTHTHIGTLANYGAYHGIELIYLFNNFGDSYFGGSPLHTPQDDSVEYNMLHYWVNFAHSGDPNNDGLEEWPALEADSDCYLEIKATPNGSQCGLRSLKSNLWDAVVGFTGCTPSVSTEIISATDKKWTIFPNPTTGYFRIKPDDEYSPINIKIFDATGSILVELQNTVEFNLGSYPAGIYYLSIKSQHGVAIQKVVKQ